MGRDAVVDQAMGLVPDHDEYVEHAEIRCDRDAEVAAENSLSVATRERCPAQICPRPVRWTPGHVFTDGTKANMNAQFQQ